MKQIKINSNGVPKTLPLPEVPGEVKLSQALQFNYAYDAFHAWRNKELGDDIEKVTWQDLETVEHKREYLEHIANCCSEFFDIPVKEWWGVKTGKVSGHIMRMSEPAMDEVADNMMSIFTWIYKVIASYTPRLRSKEDCAFEYKGERYTIPYFLIGYIEKGEANDDLSVAESIECLEVKKAVEKLKKKQPVSARFTEIMNLLAILARKEGQTFPDSQVAINALIDRQSKEFQEIDMVAGIDTAFFLSGITRS
jgi:hypothetical protein